MKHKWINITALSLSALFLISCATKAVDEQFTEIKNADVQIVATDLVSALLQVPGYDAWSVTLQVSPSPNVFGDAVTEALISAGYGIQKVKQDQGQNYVSYRKSVTSSDKGTITTFQISVKDVTLFRDYRYKLNRWIPTSPMRIKGVPPTSIAIFDDLHLQEGVVSNFVTGVEFLNRQGKLVKSTKRVVSIKNPNTRLAGERIVAARYLILSNASIFTKQRALNNEILQSYTPISSVTLKFPSSDNSFLGKPNKIAIAELIKQMSPDTDGFIIRGCSHGQSLMWDGTEGDSLERQIRVNKELLVSGVDHELIREKSCFPSPGEVELPKQSVVLTLRRNINAL